MANLRDLMNIVSGVQPERRALTEGQILTEAQNYDDMFSKLAKFVMVAKPQADQDGYGKALPSEKDDPRWTPEGRTEYAREHVIQRAKEEIQWARATLKRNDRIVWYLRFARLNIIQNLMRDFDRDPFEQMIEAEVKQFRQKNNRSEMDVEGVGGVSRWHNEIDRMASNLHYIRRQLEHYMSYSDKIKKIHDYVFSWQLPVHIFEDLGHFETLWKQERSGVIPHDDEDKPYIEFTDGFAWILLDRPYCEDEGEAMGHCGNRGSPANGDRILSLRKKVMIDNELHWRPSLTFILHSDGMLGEMKGRGNDKPAEKYHRYIISLLESDIVKGIQGGGYMPENNFSMTDLKPEEADALMEKKPALATPLFYYNKIGGVDDVLVKMIRDRGFGKTVNHYAPSFVKFSKDGHTAYLAEFDNIAEFMNRYGDKDAVKYVELDGSHEMYGVEDTSSYNRGNVWELLDSTERHAIGLWIEANESGAIDDWCEEEGYDREDFDPSDSRDVLGVIELMDDDWVQALNSGFYSGQEVGAENEIYQTVEKELKGSWNLVGDMTGSLEYDRDEAERQRIPESERGGLIYDTKCYLTTTTPEFLRYASNGAPDDFDSYMEEEIEIQQPYYGWSGFDDDAAVERFKDEAPDYSEFVNKLKASKENTKAA